MRLKRKIQKGKRKTLSLRLLCFILSSQNKNEVFVAELFSSWMYFTVFLYFSEAPNRVMNTLLAIMLII